MDHLEAEGPIVVSIEGIKQEVRVGAGICGGAGAGEAAASQPLFPSASPLALTALREEPGVDEREGFLIHKAAGTLLAGKWALVRPQLWCSCAGGEGPPNSRS